MEGDFFPARYSEKLLCQDASVAQRLPEVFASGRLSDRMPQQPADCTQKD
jgi:hypothetical protein